ncbi:hypothetical protein [Demetria terragena]|uniref:hypothetical protein n=1 Tax=Demetria terragena TaxID=63959 RepID=UPI00037FCCC9|nr:hypothetical protein [Demetria terragena]
MKVLYDLALMMHLLGMAALVGGWLAVLAQPRVSALMVWGARLQLITGIIMVGLGEGVASLDLMPDRNKVGLKLLIALAVVALAEIARGREKRGEGEAWLVNTAGYLAVLNVVIAVAWG